MKILYKSFLKIILFIFSIISIVAFILIVSNKKSSPSGIKCSDLGEKCNNNCCNN